ncbi:pseudoazurin [Tepidicaulis marinus]|uniref:Pseudoazurin n=1 Tax=Tepidicaulis marinus TaxID=1333998 RepID=A0A081B6V7_9HYPH|nr:pseudoazurin [Tepidicaulis marinus]GAK43775.1 pseudoazurin [Tepidicaulis marinus]
MMKTAFHAAMAILALTAPAQAAEVEVKMLNRGEAGMMVFEPALVKIAPGDTVRFVPTNPGHNAQSRPGMLPEGAEPFQGAMGKEIAVTFEKEGVYGYDCMPHYGMGMVGLVVVGDPSANLDEAQAVKHRGKATGRFEALFAALKN